MLKASTNKDVIQTPYMLDTIQKWEKKTEYHCGCLDSYIKVLYRKQIKKALKTIAPIKLYINSLIELENLGYSFEYCIEQMKSNEWQTVKKEYIHKQTKPQQKTRAESNREFIAQHYGINEDGNIIDTEIM